MFRQRIAGPVPALPAVEQRGICFAAPRGRLRPVLALTILACGPAPTPRNTGDVVDDAGRAVPLNPPAVRILSVSPAITDMIVALGAAHRLVTRSAYDTNPLLAHLPSTGRSLAPGVESVLRYEPDLVIVDAFAEGLALANALERVGVRAYAAHVHGMRVTEILTSIQRLGALLGAESRADSLTRSLQTEFDKIKKTGGLRDGSPTGLYIVWPSPAHVATAASYVSELMHAAGIRNAFGDVDLPWSHVSMEMIVQRDPDFLIVPAPSIESRALMTLPGWRELRAVRKGRIIVVDESLFGRPGPRFPEAVRILVRERQKLGARS